jgi:hypothetical protein
MRQRMSISTKKELVLRIRREYLVANRRRKTKLLNSLIDATGYNRKYAILLLNQSPKRKPAQRRSRQCKYGSDVLDAVRQLWQAANGICAKRLHPFLPTLIETLDRFGHLKLDKQLKKLILGMSVSTLERMLKTERDRDPKAVSLTRPGSLLKKQIAVKTFAEWNDQKVGFFEVDLVAHCGGDISGKFMHTLTMTDVATGWTEFVPLEHKLDDHVRIGIEKVIRLLPFQLQGIDCDNRGEFLNHKMVAWCKARKITFTRSRAYRKNDQCHVEEKNGSIIRRMVGYGRYDSPRAMELMTELYSVARLYVNFFQPSMKLIEKTRYGSKVTKEYDTAMTPLERLLRFKSTPPEKRSRLQGKFRKLDPVALLAEMARLQSELWRAASKGTEPPVLESARTNTQKKVGRTTPSRCSGRRQEESTGKQPPQYSIPERAVRKEQQQTTRVAITKDFVENAIAPTRGQIIYRDARLIGFGLRLTAGSKSFVAEKRVNGKLRRVTIGRADLLTVEEARARAVELLRLMITGIEPLTLGRRKQ